MFTINQPLFVMESLILLIICLGCFAFFFFRGRYKAMLSLCLHMLLVVIGSWRAFQVLSTGAAVQVKLVPDWPLTPVVRIDSLSAYFLLVISLTMLTGALYAYGYLKPYRDGSARQKPAIHLSIHYVALLGLHLSMLLVSTLREGTPFLVAWELMTVSSFGLVLFDSERRETLQIGIMYFVQMHIGFALIMGAFLIANAQGAAFGFDGLTTYFATHSALPLFVVLFIGFGIKAGFVPLHTWLPHAHPAAPSHVSGIMSGVMIKMGIYGILRVLLSIHTDLFAIGIIILSVSLVSGLLGVMNAIVQHDIKKLLAYHSIENIGIIGIGIGLGVLGVAMNMPVLAVLGFAGGILHILNHALFKSLLFYGAGAVYQTTHTRTIDQLGGLIKRMPQTGMLFLIGALAISGLPPFNGFISEFLIYSGLFQALRQGDIMSDILMLAVILGLTLIGGLAVFCFTKVFSIVFLGSPRMAAAKRAEEVNSWMLAPKWIIAAVVVVIGFVPVPFAKWAVQLAALYTPVPQQALAVYPVLQQVGLAGLVIVGISAGIWLLRVSAQKRVIVAYGPTWGCGYSGADPAVHQYTATSYAANFQELVGPVVGVQTHYKAIEEDEIFPQPRKFDTHSHDIFEEAMTRTMTRPLLQASEKSAVFQTGKLNHYLLYAFAFMALVFLLTYLNLI